jgi:hypothetical protein
LSPQPVREATATIFLSPEASQVANLTRTPGPVTPLATLTPLLNISSSTQQSCIAIKENSANLQDNKNDVVVIAQDKTSSEIYDKLPSPYLYNLQTGERNLIDGSSFAVSLDKKKLAYVSQDGKLVIANSDGVSEKELPFEDIAIIQWLENGFLVEGYKQLVFMSQETGERQILNTKLPSIYDNSDGTLDWNPSVLPNPSISRAVYVALDDVSYQTYISLWDLENQKELASVSRGPALSAISNMQPQWSIDGQQVVIASVENYTNFDVKLVSISNQGNVKVLWDIPQNIGTINFSLSPDQTKIAFWSPAPTENYDITNLSLYVLDIQTGLATDYCIISPEIPPQPIWSPGSTKLVVDLRQDLGNSNVVVVDLENKTAIKIADDAQPVGWMMKEP